MADHNHLPLRRGFPSPVAQVLLRSGTRNSSAFAAAWGRLVDWPSGNVDPVLRADYRCAGLGCRLAAGRDPAVRVGWRHGRTASICADAWSPERIAGNSKRFRFCFQLREVSGDFARQASRITASVASPIPFRERSRFGGHAFHSPTSSAEIVSAALRDAATRYVGACDRSGTGGPTCATRVPTSGTSWT
jgi:hypothetical protein